MAVALAMILTMSNCKKKEDGNSGTSQDAPKVNVSCVVPINDGDKSDFTNLMTDGSIKWSTGTERIYVAIPDETNPQIIELTAFTTIGANILNFEALVPDGLLKNEQEYDVWYLGNSKNLDNPYITETKEDDVIKSISGSIGTQSGNLSDLGYCHIAKTTVTAIVQKNGKVVLSMNGELKNQIAIAYLDLNGISRLNGNAIIGTEYTLQYNNGAFEFVITEDENAKINVTEGTAASYIVLLPNATADVDLLGKTYSKVTFENGVQSNKIYYKHISDMEYKPLTWTIYEVGYVDLGLPSGLKWATCNVGANKPEDYGDYFAWGEISTKTEYPEGISQTSGVQMGDISGNAVYDAATANWGTDWRMPTQTEMQELIEGCTWEWTTSNSVNGYRVTGTNGNSIFLPAAGRRDGSSLYSAGGYGYYWSSTPYYGNNDYAYYLYFDDGDEYVRYNYRYYGHTVRPVFK